MAAIEDTIERKIRERMASALARIADLEKERDLLAERVEEYREILGENRGSSRKGSAVEKRYRVSPDTQELRINTARSVLERAGKPMRMGDLHAAVVREIGADAAGEQRHLSAAVRHQRDTFAQGLRGYWSLLKPGT